MPSASLIITNSGVPGFVPVPGFIEFGELTLNWADGILYFKDSSGVIQAISAGGPPILQLNRLPVNEGPWLAYELGSGPNTGAKIVQKSVGTVPRLKTGEIASGENTILVENRDITVSILAGTTVNEIRGLIESDVNANALIYFFTDFPGLSDGTGIAEPDPIGSAVFENANGIIGDRAAYIGQLTIVSHSDFTTSEWVATQTNPTKWSPTTPGVIWNRTIERWERMYSQNGSFQSELLPNQASIP